jgi:hypothetical protein
MIAEVGGQLPGMLVGMAEHQILHDEFDVDQATADRA